MMNNGGESEVETNSFELYKHINKKSAMNGQIQTKWKRSRNKMLALRKVSKIKDDLLLFGIENNY